MGRLPDNIRKPMVGLMGRQHIVISGDNGHIGPVHQLEGILVTGLASGKPMGQITAGQGAPVGILVSERVHSGQVALARSPASLDNPVGHLQNHRLHGALPR